MTPATGEIRNCLVTMHRHIRKINAPDFPTTDEARMRFHNELQQGGILLAWEQAAVALGEEETIREAGFEIFAPLRNPRWSFAPRKSGPGSKAPCGRS